MKRRKLPYLWALLLALPLVALCFLLQSIPTEETKAARPYVPELWDLYEQSGLTNGQSLSEEKVLETESVVAYADRVFSLNTVLPNQADYALQVAQAVQRDCPGVKDFYLLPIPGRGVLEPDYPQQREQFETFVEGLSAGNVIQVLPQLQENGGRNLYYRTENGWNMEGAFYGYQAILEALGMEPDNLQGYRTYLFGDFHGSELTAQKAVCKSEELRKRLRGIPNDPYTLYINSENPNREILTEKTDEGIRTVERRTVRMSCMGPNGIVGGNDFLHSMVNGRGDGGVILIADHVGKLLAPYLSEVYEWVYVVNVREDTSFRQDLPRVLEEIGADTVIYAAPENRLGNESYMRALNPFVRGEE